MPTYARKHQLTNSLIYHIYNRSNARVPIFRTKEDYCYFMDLFNNYSLRFNLKVYHWVIMPNHYHLLLELAEPEMISKIMAGLSKAYSCYHHKTYSLHGFLWQGRFKSQPVQKERYLIACGRYIERNPIKAGIVKEAYEYPYSSARFYVFGEPDGITVEDSAFIEFGISLEMRRTAYMKFLQEFNTEEEKIFNNLERPVGSRDFVRGMFKVNGHLIPKRSGRPKK